jgi:hypothetical protein
MLFVHGFTLSKGSAADILQAYQLVNKPKRGLDYGTDQVFSICGKYRILCLSVVTLSRVFNRLIGQGG